MVVKSLTALGVITMEDMQNPVGWMREIDATKFKAGFFMVTGRVDEMIGWIEYKDGTIQIGEAGYLKPYTHLYEGTDRIVATSKWILLLQTYAVEPKR